MSYIKVWCEYDISGSFGGNNNEEVFAVPDSYTSEDIDKLLTEKYASYSETCDCDESLLADDLMGWSFISIESLV